MTPEDPMEEDGDVPDLSDDEDEEPTRGGGAAVRKLFFEEGAEEEDDEEVDARPRFAIRSAARTDPGTKVTENEDAFVSHDELHVVADGMGGHAGGEIASELAVNALTTTFLDQNPTPLLLLNVPPEATQLVQGIAAANEAVRGMAARTPWLSEMGTTIVAARFSPRKGRVYIAHVGDSRCYRLRDGAFEQLTRDHTMAEYGLSGRDARRLSRAVGSNGIIETDLSVLVPVDGDVYLLCSDGLTKALPDDAIAEILDGAPDPDDAADELIERARAARARDNVTVIVVFVTTSSW